eukprot:Gb_13845 [translate_table: standard]
MLHITIHELTMKGLLLLL